VWCGGGACLEVVDDDEPVADANLVLALLVDQQKGRRVRGALGGVAPFSPGPTRLVNALNTYLYASFGNGSHCVYPRRRAPRRARAARAAAAAAAQRPRGGRAAAAKASEFRDSRESS